MFNPENQLERLLMKSALEPAYRGQFYRDFLEAEILVVPVGNLPVIQNGIIQAEGKLSLQQLEVDGTIYLPFFTSVPRLQTVIREGREYLVLGVRPFLEMTKGSTLLLNPGSDYGKEFLPDEVSQLLDGSMFQPQTHHVTHRATEVLLSQPAKYPTKLVESLRNLYSTLPEVRAAYLAQCFAPSQDRSPGLLIAIDANRDWDQIVSESAICSKGLIPEHDHLDFIEFEKSGLQEHFLQTKPFYKRSIFKRLFSK